MDWYAINTDYADYLRQFCPNIPFTNYSNNRLKCFLGIVLEVNNCEYFAPLTSWKEKFNSWNNGNTFFKIEDPVTKKGLSAINLLYMFPVVKGQYEKITLSNLPKFRTFNNESEKYKYWNFLNLELSLIDKNIITNSAKSIYNTIAIKRDSKCLKLGIDYKLAEKKCLEYQNSQNKDNQKESEETKSNVVSLDKKQPLDLNAYKQKAQEYNNSRANHKGNDDLEL